MTFGLRRAFVISIEWFVTLSIGSDVSDSVNITKVSLNLTN